MVRKCNMLNKNKKLYVKFFFSSRNVSFYLSIFSFKKLFYFYIKTKFVNYMKYLYNNKFLKFISFNYFLYYSAFLYLRNFGLIK